MKILPDTVCKTVHQYSKELISDGDMKRLQEIADDYSKVKNYVYARFGGMGSLSKLYPGYTVQNEMIKSGLREQLCMPSVYFYLAIFDALGDIKAQWTKTKSAVLARIKDNGLLTEEERHYLRYLLKVNNAFDAVLNRRPVSLKADMQEQYEKLAGSINAKRADSYLCRQVRLLHRKPHTSTADGFSLSERAYRYGEHGIYITAKEKRKRIFIPLTDNNQYTRQLYIKLSPEKNSIEIQAPVEVRVQKHEDYTKKLGLAAGIYTMLTTDEGHVYGEKLGEYQTELAEWVRSQAIKHSENEGEKSERKKYKSKKKRMTQQLHNYINMELNRFLRTEKPETIYIPKLPGTQKHSGKKEINHSVNMWQRGYIRGRLKQKCKEQSIELVEVFGKNISRECSSCGAYGYKENGMFLCKSCGYTVQEKCNAAQNAKNRGEARIKSDQKDGCPDK